MSQTNCSSCVQSRVGEQCFLRLFGLVDSTFTPQPHGSIEYGDYARLVTIDGHPGRYLVVLMKRAPTKSGPITSSSREGREILEQAFKYMQDAGSHVIGVSVPTPLHDNLKKMLIQLARFHNKKVVFIDEQVLARMVSSAMARHNLRLNQL